MRSMMKALGISVVAALMVAGLSVRAQAAPIVYVSPVSQLINISNVPEFDVDILVKDADEAIGGYDYRLTWDGAILELVGLDRDPDGNWTNDSVDGTFPDPFTDAVNFIDIFLTGDPAGDNSASDDFRMTSLRFKALDVGDSQLNLSFVTLSDEGGDEDIAGVTSQDGLVCVARLGSEGPQAPVLDDPSCTVPEPTMLSLLAAGLATAVVRRRKRS